MAGAAIPEPLYRRTLAIVQESPKLRTNEISAGLSHFPAMLQRMNGTFDEKGKAMLYYVGKLEGSSALVHPVVFPGCQAIGSGAYNALMWLNYRHQRLNLSMRQSALHAYEASRMAASAPAVNDDPDILIATAKESFWFSRKVPALPEYPITLEELNLLAKKYGPRNTDALGFSKSSDLQKSESQT